MKKIILLTILFLGFNFKLESQIQNVYFYSVENKKTNDDLNTLAHFVYLDTKLKLNRFKVFHYTPTEIPDVIWENKKKQKVIYKNSKIDCDFDFKEQFLSIYEANRINEDEVFSNYLLVSSEDIANFEKNKQFKIKEINTNSELSIQKEVNKILAETSKENTNIYIIQNSFKSTKPVFQFTKDSIIGNGKVEVNYKTSTAAKEFIFNTNEKQLTKDLQKLVVEVNMDKNLKGYYIDENGCKSNEDIVSIFFKNDCNCEKSTEKPEILYSRSPNILKKESTEDADWEYKLIPEGASGSLSYEFAIKNVCADRFIVEIKDINGGLLTKQYYELNELDERSSNPLAVNNKDLLVFLLNLDDKRNQIIPTDALFYISIIPELKNEECNKRKFTSQKVRFSKCR